MRETKVSKRDMSYLVDHFVLAGPKWWMLERLSKGVTTWGELIDRYPVASDELVQAYHKLYSSKSSFVWYWIKYFVGWR